MNKKNKIKAIVALAVALAFVMPGAVAFANVGTIGVISDSENTGDMENGDMENGDIENIVEISTNSDTNTDETEESNTLSTYPDALLIEGGQIETQYPENDVGVESINYPVDGGIYPIGDYVVNAAVKNHGDDQSSFFARMEIKKVILEYEINVFFDDMESGSNKWTIVDGNKDNDMWTIKTDKYHSSTHSWKCTADSRYHANANDDLITSILNFSDAKSATLQFWHWCNGEPGFDYGGVYLSCDNGTTWKKAMSSIYWTKGWEKVKINIGNYISLTDKVLIKFNWISDPLWQNYGWYIDDVYVNKVVPEKYITIKTDFKEVKDLLSGESRDVLFELWNACEDADYVISVKTLLSNDENLGNDGKEIRISVGDVLDVEVTSPSCPKEIEYGNILPINAVVHNRGNLDTESFEVTCGIYKYMQEKTEIFKEGFEKHWVPDSNEDLAPPGWEVHIYSEDDWSWDHPSYWHQSLYAHSGSYGAGVWLPSPDYDYMQREWLITPEIDLKCDIDVELRFWTYTEGMELEGGGVVDRNYIKVSTDGGASWETVCNLNKEVGPNYYESEVTVDLSKYSGQKIKIAFNRHAPVFEGGYGTYWLTPWMVDDVSIYARIPYPEPVWEESKNISAMEPGDTIDLEWIWHHPDYCHANIKITTELDGDMKEKNDQGIITVTRIIKTWYTNDVESGKLGWEGIDLSPFHPSNWHMITGDGSHYFWCGDEKIEVEGYKGGYGPNWNDGLYIKEPLNLSLTNSARLKFKTWHYISNDGKGYVEVSRDNSTWETIDSYKYSSSWVEKTLDLSDYTNETVYIRFRFASYHNSGIKGWFIDDVKVEQLIDGIVIATPFEDDMEYGDGKWIKKWIPGAQLWHIIDKKHHKSVSHCNSPTHSWVCMDEEFNGYYGYMDDALTSPEFNLSQSFRAYVEFSCAYSIMNSIGWEATGYFEVTNDGGKTWNELGKFGGKTRHCMNDIFYWGHHEFDISEYLPGIIQVRFRLETDYRNFNYYYVGFPYHAIHWGGWYVDDIGIKAMFDEESPKTKCDLTGNLGKDDWYISPVTVTLEAMDEGSGVDYTMYKLDDDVYWRKYIGSFPVSGDDVLHTLQYFSVDYVGNEEDPCDPIEFKIDKTNPTIKLTWNEDDSKLVADVDDDTSGVDRVEFSVNGEYVGTAVRYPYEWIVPDPQTGDKGQAIVFDNAGNKAVSSQINAVSRRQSSSSTPVQRAFLSNSELTVESITDAKSNEITDSEPELDAGRVWLRGLLFRCNRVGDANHAMALRLHYIEFTPRTTSGMVMMNHVIFGDPAYLGRMYEVGTGMFTYVLGFFEGGLEIL